LSFAPQIEAPTRAVPYGTRRGLSAALTCDPELPSAMVKRHVRLLPQGYLSREHL